MREIEELPIPDAIFSAEEKAELARIWVADGNQVVIISSRLWDDPGAWGLMLVDFAYHIASAYESRGMDKAAVVSKIRAAMRAEWGDELNH